MLPFLISKQAFEALSEHIYHLQIYVERESILFTSLSLPGSHL